MNNFSYKWLTIAGIAGIALVGCPQKTAQTPANPEQPPAVAKEVTITPSTPTSSSVTPGEAAAVNTPVANPTPVPSPTPNPEAKVMSSTLIKGKRLDPFVVPRLQGPSILKDESVGKSNENVNGSPFVVSGILLSSAGNYAILYNNNLSKNVIVKTGDFIDPEKQYKVSSITANQVIVAFGKQTEKLSIASFEDRGPYPGKQMKASNANTEEKESSAPTMNENQETSPNAENTPPPPPPPGAGKPGQITKPAGNESNVR